MVCFQGMISFETSIFDHKLALGTSWPHTRTIQRELFILFMHDRFVYLRSALNKNPFSLLESL